MNYTFCHFEEGDLIIKEGSSSTEFFILIEGNAKIILNQAPDRVVAELKAGDIFGEMSYLAGKHRSANVVACGKRITVMRLSRESMRKMSPEIRDAINHKLIELLVYRINTMNDIFSAHSATLIPPEHPSQPGEEAPRSDRERPWWRVWE